MLILGIARALKTAGSRGLLQRLWSPLRLALSPGAGPSPWGWAWMARDLEAGIHDDLMHLDTCWAPLVSCVLSNRAAVL